MRVDKVSGIITPKRKSSILHRTGQQNRLWKQYTIRQADGGESSWDNISAPWMSVVQMGNNDGDIPRPLDWWVYNNGAGTVFQGYALPLLNFIRWQGQTQESMSNTQGPFPGSPMRPNGEYMYLSRLYAGLSANTYSIFKITFQNTTQAPLLSSGFRTSIRLNIDSSATKNYNYYMVYPPEPDEPYPVYYEEAIPNATYLAQNTTYAIKVTYRSGVAETYDINTTLPEGRARSEKVQSIEILATLPEAPQYNDINVWQTIQFELGIFVFNPTITTGDAPGHRTDPQPPPPPPSNPTIVGIAQRFVGRLTYTMSSARSQLPSLNGTDVGYADCSSYVAHVLNLAGYTNFSAAGDYTATLVTKLTNMGKIIAYSFDSSMMQPGDILIMSENSTAGEGAASHAAIFFGTYNGATNQLIECYGKGGSNNAAITGFLTSYNRAGRFDYKWLARM